VRLHPSGSHSKASLRMNTLGRAHTPETREKQRQAALRRERKPRAKRSNTVKGGHEFARRWFPLPSLCDDCSVAPPVDRHHVDGDPTNNVLENIAFLCRRCHQKRDGRHERLKYEIPSLGGRSHLGKKKR
jgi:hypothetical protein